jgi:hypothetical protein
MLPRTFCHIPGVGLGYERRLWERGVRCWQDCASAPLTGKRADTIRRFADQSRRALDAGDARFFAAALPPREHWRLFTSFQAKAAYLDIETTGLGGPEDHVTTVVLYDGQRLRHYVCGQNLEQFEHDVAAYDLLITYNGKSFDVPFLRRTLGLRLDHAHIDLMHALRALGIRGGLKAAEQRLGLTRPGMEHLDGYTAVLLWRLYEHTADNRVLQTLLAYNAQDVISLEFLMAWAFNQKLYSTPFAHELCLPIPPLADNPFEPDPQVVRDVCHWSPADLSLALGRD